MRYLSSYFTMVGFMMIIAFSGTSAPTFGFSGARSSDTILIVPARPAVLQLAFDLAKMRDISIVSFRGQVNTDKPLLHIWKGNDWQYVSFDDFRSLQFAEKAPKTVILIGDDQVVPKVLFQDMGWPCKIERLSTINVADLVNGLNPYFQFSSSEWKQLADSYGLKLEDVNTQKREFNPYNVPRSKLPLEKRDFKQEKGDLPPAVLIEKSGSPVDKKTDKTAEKPWIK